MMIDCPECGGLGSVIILEWKWCSICKGKGKIRMITIKVPFTGPTINACVSAVMASKGTDVAVMVACAIRQPMNGAAIRGLLRIINDSGYTDSKHIRDAQTMLNVALDSLAIQEACNDVNTRVQSKGSQ